MPTDLPGRPSPRLLVLDVLGTLVDHDDAVRRALAAAFQAHGEHVDPDVAGMCLGYPGATGIERLMKWLHPREEPHRESCKSIHDLAVKELTRLVRFGGEMQVVAGVEKLLEVWTSTGRRVAATSTLHPTIVRALMARLGWDRRPPFEALVLAEEVARPTPGPDMILECMRRVGVTDVAEVAKVANSAIGLADAKALGCGWCVLLDRGGLTTDQIAAIAPTAIVDRVEDLGLLWRSKPTDGRLEREIQRVLGR